jgi:hypothetical protein
MLTYSCVFLATAVSPQVPSLTENGAGVKRRTVTVQDSIQMTRLADPAYVQGASSKGHVAHFSSDGKRFAVVLMKGNLQEDTNDYSLTVF